MTEDTEFKLVPDTEVTERGKKDAEQKKDDGDTAKMMIKEPLKEPEVEEYYKPVPYDETGDYGDFKLESDDKESSKRDVKDSSRLGS